MWFIVPSRIFGDDYSTLIYSREGKLMGARIADDGQWRFPTPDSLPSKYITALTCFENKRFFWHPGVDPIAMGRALFDNAGKNRIVSGGSTIMMQVARIARGNRPRNIYNKFVESVWALYLETRYSKKSILKLYAAHAPFGGNVVGAGTAAWRYFGRDIGELSWAEAATLAVLPNSPALIHPGRNRTALREKRDALLRKLLDKGKITVDEYEKSLLEGIPQAPAQLPNTAYHLLEKTAAVYRGKSVSTTIDSRLQEITSSVVASYCERYRHNHIYNMATIIADVETGEVLAYVGNSGGLGEADRGMHVDVITSPRSTGSILKPILYAGLLDDGRILPNTLIPDMPLNIGGFTPQNYSRTFHGAVPARRAVERSLNVPLVRMLGMYNTGRFMVLLQRLGMSTLVFSEDHYGASLILGGAEGTLWDIAGMYVSMARILMHYSEYGGRYNPSDIRPLNAYSAGENDPVRWLSHAQMTGRGVLSAGAIWFAFEAMSGLDRPEEEADWQQFSSMKKVAWKTGTSYGGRDAWSIGVTSRYVVGVWVGNASGEGRPGLTGVGYAAPVMFDIFARLPSTEWFRMPEGELEKTVVCRQSGYKASDICPDRDTVFINKAGIETEICPFHRIVHLSTDHNYRVNSSCETASGMVAVSWFVLPPAQEYYYINFNASYRPLPPLRPGCGTDSQGRIDIIYPKQHSKLYLPVGFSGEREKFIFRAAHSDPDGSLYWYIDDVFFTRTNGSHEMACRLELGAHLLTVIDEAATRKSVSFEVVTPDR